MKFEDKVIHTIGTSFGGHVVPRLSDGGGTIAGVGSEVGDGRCV